MDAHLMSTTIWQGHVDSWDKAGWTRIQLSRVGCHFSYCCLGKKSNQCFVASPISFSFCKESRPNNNVWGLCVRMCGVCVFMCVFACLHKYHSLQEKIKIQVTVAIALVGSVSLYVDYTISWITWLTFWHNTGFSLSLKQSFIFLKWFSGSKYKKKNGAIGSHLPSKNWICQTKICRMSLYIILSRICLRRALSSAVPLFHHELLNIHINNSKSWESSGILSLRSSTVTACSWVGYDSHTWSTQRCPNQSSMIEFLRTRSTRHLKVQIWHQHITVTPQRQQHVPDWATECEDFPPPTRWFI